MNKIILIDDDEDDLFFFTDAIKCMHPQPVCETAMNGKAALNNLQKSTVLPDMIFLDLNMPLMNGFEFLINIKKDNRLSEIPVGIYSTSSIISDIALSKKLGANFYLTKPNDMQMLRKKLQEIFSADFKTVAHLVFA